MLTHSKLSLSWLLVFMLTLTLVLGLSSAAFAADFRTGSIVTIGKGEVIDDDLLISGQRVVVDGTVQGDLLTTAGEVVINGTVQGSVFAAGQSVTVNGKVGGTLYMGGAVLKLGPQAVIERNLFAGGYSVSADPGSQVQRDGSIGAYQAILKGKIVRDLRAGVAALELNGTVGRDAYVDVGDPASAPPPNFWRFFMQGEMPTTLPAGLRIGSDAKIGGKLNYVSPVEQTSGIQAQPAGGIAYSTPPPTQTNAGEAVATVTTTQPQNPVVTWLLAQLREWVALLILGGLVLWLIPNPFMRVVEHVRGEPLPATGWGFVVTIIGYLAALLAFVVLIALVAGLAQLTLSGLAMGTFWGGATGIGTGLTLFTLLLAYGSKLVVAYPVGQWLLRQVQGKPTEPVSGWRHAWPLLIGLLLYVLVSGIPYFGWLVALLVSLMGLGAMWLSIRPSTPKVAVPKLVLSPA